MTLSESILLDNDFSMLIFFARSHGGTVLNDVALQCSRQGGVCEIAFSLCLRIWRFARSISTASTVFLTTLEQGVKKSADENGRWPR